MARPEPRLIEALRLTARRLERGADYRWTHMGQCNCGHLAQTVTRKSSAELHRLALEKPGDWTQQALDYCPTSGYTMDHVLQSLLDLGLDHGDLGRLEKLSDAKVLARVEKSRRPLDKRSRPDLVLYLRTWADQLEGQWLEGQAVPSYLPASAPVRVEA
ncbi:MAG: hypothetical protein AAGF23_14045 [Acidobacteriota bacterium]